MLTDAKIRAAKPAEKDYKLGDEKGLYLFVTKGGGRLWRMKYRFAGKEQRLGFGAYPEVSLAEARRKCLAARQLLDEHKNPAVEKRKLRSSAAENAANTFERMTRTWHETQKPRWAPVHAADVLASLERDAFPDLGSLPIRDIDAPTVLATLRKIEKRGSIETAKRVRQRISGVFVFAISEGKADTDPAAIVTKALKPLVKRGKQPSLKDVDEARELIRAVEASACRPWTKAASRLLALTAVRPGVIRFAEWPEFEGIEWEAGAVSPDAIWRIPVAKMKLTVEKKDDSAREHLVPLTEAAVDVLRTIRRLTGNYRYVFPNDRFAHRPMSENALAYRYKTLGYQGRHVPHGWRATFSTNINEMEGRAPDTEALVELMLAHVPDNRVKAAYDRATHMKRRREVAQIWSDWIMGDLAPAATLLEGKRG